MLFKDGCGGISKESTKTIYPIKASYHNLATEGNVTDEMSKTEYSELEAKRYIQQKCIQWIFLGGEQAAGTFVLYFSRTIEAQTEGVSDYWQIR